MLTDRVAVVTGAANGLGRAYATRLAAAGAHVVIVDIAGDAAHAAAAAIAGNIAADAADPVTANASGTATGTLDGTRAAVMSVAAPAAGTVEAYQADVTDADQVARVVTDVVTRWGRIDALVNNAGGALLPSAPFDAFDQSQWARILDVNLTAQWLCAAAVVPHMRRAGYGKIVNVSSTTVSRGGPIGLAPYIAAKAGVVGLTRALARELGPDGIRVNAIAPGYIPVDTPKDVHTPEAAAALRARMVAEQCLPTLGTPEDLSPVVEFLCSTASDFITGQVLNADAGWVHL